MSSLLEAISTAFWLVCFFIGLPIMLWYCNCCGRLASEGTPDFTADFCGRSILCGMGVLIGIAGLAVIGWISGRKKSKEIES